MHLFTHPPSTKEELMQRANDLAGLRFGEVAKKLDLPLPKSMVQAKGWLGCALEKLLGADAGCEAAPDFTQLNIELKTLPIDEGGQVLESTYVTIVDLLGMPPCWLESVVYQKLQHVLFIPVEGHRSISYPDRRIASPFLWSPTGDIAKQLEADWSELSEYLTLGRLDAIHGGIGTYLHIRPKGADAKSTTTGRNELGERIKTLPRGYYLRQQLTQQIINSHFI